MTTCENYKSVMQTSQAATERSFCLIAVTKKREASAIMPLLEAGHRDFGENTVQEMIRKWPDLKDLFPDIRMHFIGKLQRNKVKEAIAFADIIHSVDSERLMDAIADACDATGRCVSCFLQVNIGNEPQKSGCDIDRIGDLYTHARTRNLHVEGLMCIPPNEGDPRDYFKHMRALADTHELTGLSMGMSSDYVTALEERATHIRVGSALFL